MMSLIPEESEARLQALFGDEFRRLSKIEVQALVTADVENFVDNMRLRQVTGNHATDITRILQGLVSKGALVQEGRTRGTRYRLPKEKLTLTPYIRELTPYIRIIDSVYKGADSVHKDN